MINIIPKYYFEDIHEFQLELNDNKNVIGTGSFGVVKMALHRGTNKIYAIKIINLSKIDNEAQLKIIERQIKLHSQLDHPHIVKLWDTLIQDSIVYMIMEYCEKGNLFYYQNTKMKFSEAETFQYFYQCAKAVDYIHKQNIIHRDIKPQNLLLDHNFNLKICDFGWSAQDINLKRSTFCGTYEYMAPEMILKKFYNYKIDIWGLGILLYELLHGYAPFKGNNIQMLTNQIQKGEYELDSNLSEQVRALIKALLHYNPDNRPTFDIIFKHSWIQKMKILTSNCIKKQEVASNTIIVQKLSKMHHESVQKLIKKKTHKKAESASQIQLPVSHDKKSIQINFEINNYQLVGMKDKLKKKGNLGKRCKTMNQEQMKKLIVAEQYINPVPSTKNRITQFLEQKLHQKKELKKSSSNILNMKSPKRKQTQERINTEISQKKILKKKKSVEQNLHKLSSNFFKKNKKHYL